MEEKSTEALSFVKQNPGCKVSDVQKYLGVSRPVVATIVKSLEELGFVEKKQGKGRATALFVTQKGEEFLKPKEGAVSAGTVTGVEAPSAIPVQPAASPVVARAAPQAQVTEAVPSDVKPAQKEPAGPEAIPYATSQPEEAPSVALTSPTAAADPVPTTGTFQAQQASAQQQPTTQKKGIWARLKALF